MSDPPDPEPESPETPPDARWRKVDAVFAAALDLASEERSAFLDTACGDDAILRRDVERLLENDGRAADFLESPAEVAAGLEEPPPAVAGDRIGPYRVEREIARGGMGSVYLAARADEAFERKVAIKLLHARSASLTRRFLGERQILASLDHPYIARLFEGGTTGGGRPYLVMEHVDGRPIDQYCDGESLALADRLRLFRKVCSAVHYAHQNLVVHRDIKPSNVLVTGGGEPRLLDFGIAKLLDPQAFPLTLEATATGLRPMTPHYASPEQVRGETITTVSDVYSLGVLLYQLLTGRLPHRFAGMTVREIERALSEDEPLKPSVAVALEPGGAGRQRLSRSLAGDLDTIVAKAMHRDPDRRYGSVEQLSDDVHRYLTGRPIAARQDSFGYRLSAFLHRHRAAVAVAGLVLVLMTAFAAAMAWQAAQTARQRDRAQLERDKARQVSGFLVDLFMEEDPWRAPGSELTVREVLDRGAARVERELEAQPEVQATLLDAIGSVYIHLGLHDQAAPHLEGALETRQSLAAPDPTELADSLLHVASLYRDQRRLEDAEAHYLKALAVRREAAGDTDPGVAVVRRSLARLYTIMGRNSEAEEQALRALEIFESALGTEDPEVAGTLPVLAIAHAEQGDAETARAELERALAIMEAAGEPNMRSGGILANLGVLHQRGGDFEAAAGYLERSLAIHEQILASPHPKVAGVLVVLAEVLEAAGDREAARRRLRQALDVYRRAFGDQHPAVADTRSRLERLGHTGS